MMNNYIPSNITIGCISRNFPYFNSSVKKPAIVSCKYKNRSYTCEKMFKPLTGYIRGTSRDYSKNIERDIEGAIYEIDNKPIAGFRIIGKSYCIYGAKLPSCSMLIEDPRGFTVAISQNNLFRLIQNSKMSNGIVEDKLVYAFKITNHQAVISTLLPTLEIAKTVEEDIKLSNSIDSKTNGKKSGFSYRNLKPGIVYDIDSGYSTKKMMYIGHVDAINPKSFSSSSLLPFNRRSKYYFIHSGSYWDSERYSSINSSGMPWNNEKYRNEINSISRKKMHVFVDMDICKFLDNEQTRTSKIINSILDNEYSYLRFNISSKMVLKESDEQIGWFSSTTEAIEKYVEDELKFCNVFKNEIISNFPIEKPDESAFEKWHKEEYRKFF